tara:strand:+ start:153 stop:554 length:402 start_codon:yes stop_codon:yes gene_type:complete
MIATQEITDKIAISLSLACAFHCLFFPSILLALSNFVSINFNNELIHFSLLLTIVPFSIYGLTKGLRNHKKYLFFVLGLFGIIILSLALLINKEIIGEFGEVFLTLLGSTIIAAAHFKNYRLCRHLDCDCHNQ